MFLRECRIVDVVVVWRMWFRLCVADFDVVELVRQDHIICLPVLIFLGNVVVWWALFFVSLYVRDTSCFGNVVIWTSLKSLGNCCCLSGAVSATSVVNIINQLWRVYTS